MRKSSKNSSRAPRSADREAAKARRTDTEEKLDKVYQAVHDGAYDIILGTQMLAKGFDFPQLSTLGVVQAHAGLSLPDFSSEERSYQLLSQVIGRANRGHRDSRIFIQTYQPEHQIIKNATSGDYLGMYNYLLKLRAAAKLPPYTFLLRLTMTYKTEAAVVKNIQTLFKKLRRFSTSENLSQIAITPPMPAFHEHNNSGYTWQIIVKAKSRKDLVKIFDQVEKSQYLHYDFDPYTLL